jgi:4-hydroxy-tetrahydrodipicolinate reductase
VSAVRVPIVIAGAAGRMGRMLASLARADTGLEVVGALEAPGHPQLGTDVGTLSGGQACGVTISDSLERAAVRGAVLIEFSAPAPSLEHLRQATSLGLSSVIGTTGFSATEQGELVQLATGVACVQAANMSVGVTALLEVVRQLAQRLGPSFDIEVAETHHRLKKDSPSGTALALARAAAEGRGARLEDWAVYGREGLVGERPREQIGVMALRGGDVVGDHTVYFYGTGERVEITHRAQSREAFASGALRAAAWVAAQPPGLYTMRDVLAARP